MSLNKEEKAILSKLLQKLVEDDEPKIVEKTPKKRGRPRKVTPIDEGIVKGGLNTNEIPVAPPAPDGSGIVKKGKADGKKKQKAKKYCQVLPFDTNATRENKFQSMSAFNEEKEDTKIDKLLRKGAPQTVRTVRKQQIISDVECTNCNYLFDVPASRCYKDDEGYRFVCPECESSR